MLTVKRSNGIIIRDFPSFTQMQARDERGALTEALSQLNALRGKAVLAPTWDLMTDRIYVRDQPERPILAQTNQLIRVMNGVGGIISDHLEDVIGYGYWVYVPRGVQYTLLGRVIVGMNFRVATVPVQ